MKKIQIDSDSGDKLVSVLNSSEEEQKKVQSAMIVDASVKSSQIQALVERNEFLEDLIAELAVQVYSTPPNV